MIRSAKTVYRRLPPVAFLSLSGASAPGKQALARAEQSTGLWTNHKGIIAPLWQLRKQFCIQAAGRPHSMRSFGLSGRVDKSRADRERKRW